MIRIALFASGTGTNALNLLRSAPEYSNLQVTTLIVDTESSDLPKVINREFPNVKVFRLLPAGNLKGLQRRMEHEGRIVEVLSAQKIDWIFLAGYMRILGNMVLNKYKNRILNIHPSLLPAYPGMDSYKRAFEDGVKVSGVTIHLVDEGIDTGKIVLQETFPRLETDNLSTFVQRGKELEWKMYPKMLERLQNSAKILPGE